MTGFFIFRNEEMGKVKTYIKTDFRVPEVHRYSVERICIYRHMEPSIPVLIFSVKLFKNSIFLSDPMADNRRQAVGHRKRAIRSPLRSLLRR